MTDLEPLQWLQGVLGGRIYGPYDMTKHGSNRKPLYHWYLGGWEQFERAYLLLRPLLSRRRQDRLNEVWDQAPPRETWGMGGRQRARTHCANGHEFNDANTRWYSPPKAPHRKLRVCRACEKARSRTLGSTG